MLRIINGDELLFGARFRETMRTAGLGDGGREAYMTYRAAADREDAASDASVPDRVTALRTITALAGTAPSSASAASAATATCWRPSRPSCTSRISRACCPKRRGSRLRAISRRST